MDIGLGSEVGGVGIVDTPCYIFGHGGVAHHVNIIAVSRGIIAPTDIGTSVNHIATAPYSMIPISTRRTGLLGY